MRRFGKYGFRMPLRLLPAAALVGIAGVFLFSAASLAEGPTIEATGGAYGYYWSPSTAEVGPGGSVTFKSPSSSVEHGVTWTGGPETPKCAGVPIDTGKTSWTGSCTFAQVGTYSFYCPVHPTQMKGTITASAPGSPTPPPPPPSPTEPSGSPLQGPASQALKLARSQRGNAVRGSVNLSPAAVGGRLEIDLLMARASLPDSRRVGSVKVGRLVRSGLKPGRVQFAVGLRRVARRALEERGRLSLKVRLTITPPGGKALVLNRSVAVHD